MKDSFKKELIADWIVLSQAKGESIGIYFIPGEPLCPELSLSEFALLVFLLSITDETRCITSPNGIYLDRDFIEALLKKKRVPAVLNRLFRSGHLVDLEDRVIIPALCPNAFSLTKSARVYELSRSMVQELYVGKLGLSNPCVRTREALGAAVKMIPWMNDTFNVVCRNPESGEVGLSEVEIVGATDSLSLTGCEPYQKKYLLQELISTKHLICGDAEIAGRCVTEDGRDCLVMNPRLMKTSRTTWFTSYLSLFWKTDGTLLDGRNLSEPKREVFSDRYDSSYSEAFV